LIFDAVRVRLIEVGEAVKAVPGAVLAREPDLPWSEITRMRDLLAHRYFDTTHAIVAATVSHDLPELRRAIDRLLEGTRESLRLRADLAKTGPGHGRPSTHV
jgi:uncharacterized protein with HEPN domain